MRSSAPAAVFDVSIVEQRPGIIIARVDGKGAESTFKDEAGGHRVQRIPPTERRGRVHSSTVTVAVMPEPTEAECKIDQRDLEWSTCRGSGAGGQHRNVTDSAVQLRHVPTGIMVRCESERSQVQNKRTALAVLMGRIAERERSAASAATSANRRAQVGSAERSDKRRTLRFQDGHVTDHVTGKRWQLKAYLRGDWD